jgi:Asp-tRNA(Asn)/Glu-tRNA(Gln) amidotransferase A subunit family amidase
VEGELVARGEVQYALNRYLNERGDRNIRSVADLINKSTFYIHASIPGVAPPPKTRLELAVTRTERLTKKSDGTPFIHKTPITNLDIREWHVRRTVLQMLVLKVMADHNLDALVYPTKTIPAPVLGAPVEPPTLKSVAEISTLMIDGVEYVRTSERVLDTRYPLAWRLSPNSGFPAITTSAGFTREVYDRAATVTADGSVKAGDLVGPKPIALPVSIDFLGRPFSEPTLLKIASAYEKATRHRRTPKGFPPLPGEP